MRTLNFLASVLLLSVAMNAVHADDFSDARSLTVRFADLDLAKPEGAVALFGRIKTAAKNVCEHRNGATPVQKRNYASCVDFALSNAVARVNQPALNEYFSSRSRQQAPISVAKSR